MIKRNSIIILGNGFDIAHNFPTKYSDFADHLLEVIYEHLTNYREESMISNSFWEFRDYFYENGRGNTSYDKNRILVRLVLNIQDKDKEGTIKLLKTNLDILSSILNNHFLAKLYSNNYTNWFDIENAFFEELIKIKSEILNFLEKVKVNPTLRTSGALKKFISEKKVEINQLNRELSEIKVALKEYLNSIELSIIPEINEFFKRNFKNNKRIHFINFNYTNTIELYFPLLTKLKHDIQILNIHGNLDENIIFGYGNDHNDDYQVMKELEIDEFLENFKTFEYLNNNNRYSKFFKQDLHLLNRYDVFIIGHSLQQTDKTLLSGIFNNQNCLEIHLLKRGDLKEKDTHKDYRKLIFAMSRILTTERDELRLKVIDYENIESFPS